MTKEFTWRSWFSRKRRHARRLLRDPKRAAQVVADAYEKADTAPARRSGRMTVIWADLQTLMRLARAFTRGEYRDVSRPAIIAVLGALAYFVSPIDAVLDAIPVLGLVDDSAVIAFVISEIRAELEAFRAWEARHAAIDAEKPAAALPST